MRIISLGPIIVFLFLVLTKILLAGGASYYLYYSLPDFAFKPISVSLFFVFTYIVLIFGIFHLLLPLFRFKEGNIEPKSRDEKLYFIYMLFYLLYFHPLLGSGMIPVFMTPFVFKTLGAKVGKETYFSGYVLDPQYIEVGSNTVTGFNSVLIPHVIEGNRLAHFPIQIGNNVTIGAYSIILPGVTIGDGAIVGAISVVPKGTRIGSNEIWAGNPAKFIKKTSV